MEKVVLQISDLRIERNGITILDGINWQIRKGQHWVMLGANGSGKTSLLSALTGYLAPTSGEIELLQQRFGQTDWRELRKLIGLVSSSIRQMIPDAEPALFTVMSGKDAIVDFWGNGTPRDRVRARRILKQVECEYLVDCPFS